MRRSATAPVVAPVVARVATLVAAVAAVLVVSFASVGCSGERGTLRLGLVTAPGSTLLDDVTLLRLTITEPRQIFDVPRTDAGFRLAIDLEATGAAGQLIVEGFDDGGTLRATGMSPPFPLAAIDAGIDIYMAQPLSIGRAPLELTPRGDVVEAILPYGTALVGGRLANGEPSDAMTVYNAYDHSIAAGEPMPEPRARPAVAVDPSLGIYIFGGAGPATPTTGTLWRFDTTIAPDGAYLEIAESSDNARADAVALTIAPNYFVITGTPALVLRSGVLGVRTEANGLAPRAAVTFDQDAQPVAIFLGEDGDISSSRVVRYRDDAFDDLAMTVAEDAALAPLPNGKVIAIGGRTNGNLATRDAHVIDAANGSITALPAALEVARTSASAAATSRHLIVVGGMGDDATPIASAEVFDVRTLEHLATLPCEPRIRPFVVPLPNDQFLVGGGVTPTGILELFTPPTPEL